MSWNILNRLLGSVGLIRTSRIAYESMLVTWSTDEPTKVDIRFKNGQRVAGAVNPYWPNKRPPLTYGNNPIFSRHD